MQVATVLGYLLFCIVGMHPHHGNSNMKTFTVRGVVLVVGEVIKVIVMAEEQNAVGMRHIQSEDTTINRSININKSNSLSRTGGVIMVVPAPLLLARRLLHSLVVV